MLDKFSQETSDKGIDFCLFFFLMCFVFHFQIIRSVQK